MCVNVFHNYVGVQISGRPNMKYFAVESCEQCTGSNETNTPSVDSSLSGDPNTTVLCLGRDFVRPGNAPNPPLPHPQPAPGANRAKPGFKYCTVTIEYADLPDGTEKRESFTLPTPIRACEAVCSHNATTGGLFDTAWRECHDRPGAENNHCRDVRGSCSELYEPHHFMPYENPKSYQMWTEQGPGTVGANAIGPGWFCVTGLETTGPHTDCNGCTGYCFAGPPNTWCIASICDGGALKCDAARCKCAHDSGVFSELSVPVASCEQCGGTLAGMMCQARFCSRLNALLFTAMAWIFIPAYCFAIP